MVRTDGSHRWFTQMVHTDGSHRWFTQMVHKDGSHTWFTRWFTKWCTLRVHKEKQQRDAAHAPETTSSATAYAGISDSRVFLSSNTPKAAQQFETARNHKTTAAQQLMQKYPVDRDCSLRSEKTHKSSTAARRSTRN